MRSASRARQQHQHQDAKPRSGALSRAGRTPAPLALARRLSILSPSGSPRSHWSCRARRREGGASGEAPSWRSDWDPRTLQQPPREGLRGEHGRGRRPAPSPELRPPCPRPHHARRAGVTGSARNLTRSLARRSRWPHRAASGSYEP